VRRRPRTHRRTSCRSRQSACPPSASARTRARRLTRETSPSRTRRPERSQSALCPLSLVCCCLESRVLFPATQPCARRPDCGHGSVAPCFFCCCFSAVLSFSIALLESIAIKTTARHERSAGDAPRLVPFPRLAFWLSSQAGFVVICTRRAAARGMRKTVARAASAVSLTIETPPNPPHRVDDGLVPLARARDASRPAL